MLKKCVENSAVPEKYSVSKSWTDSQLELYDVQKEGRGQESVERADGREIAWTANPQSVAEIKGDKLISEKSGEAAWFESV